ncbi:MAG: ATP synthase subunit I [Granulosicoccaceae bacterium]|jgi:F1F0 ATPase subunit 2
MSEVLQFTASLTAGSLLGLAFFWGLWATLNGLERAPRPAMRMLVSLLLRFGLVLAGFYFLARYAAWQHVLTAVVGFMLARILVARYIRPALYKKESQL